MKKYFRFYLTLIFIAALTSGINAQDCDIVQSDGPIQYTMKVDEQIGQTFTACTAGKLSSITLYVTTGTSIPNPVFKVSVTDGGFTDNNGTLNFTELAFKNVDVFDWNTVSNSELRATIDLSAENIDLVSGNTYGIAIENLTGSSVGVRAVGSSAYGGGALFFYSGSFNTAALNDLKFEVAIDGPNQAPTDISLDNASVQENLPTGTAVGSLSTTDLDASDTYTYTLSGTDATSFLINGSTLETAEVFDFETKSSYEIIVTTDDGNSGSFDKPFTITIEDQKEGLLTKYLFENSLSDSLGVHDAFAVGSPSFVDGKSGNAMTALQISTGNFARTSSEIIDFNNDYTINIFARLDQAIGSQAEFILSSRYDNSDIPQGGLIVYINTSSKLGIAYFSASGSSQTQLLSLLDTEDFPVGEWQMITITKKGSDIKLFRNAQEIASQNFTSPFDNGIRWNIGATDGGNGNRHFQGRLDDLSFYNIGLSQQEVDELLILNTAPTDLTLSASPISEDAAVGTVIGTFSTTDPDAGDTHTYEIIGDANIPSITVDGSNLIVENQLDFEGQNPFRFNVITTDAGGLTFQKLVEFEILDVNEAPTDIGFKVGASSETYDSAFAITENNVVGQNLQRWITLDQDAGDTHTYSLSGEDAALFSIGTDPQLPDDILLKAETSFDYEAGDTLQFTVTAEDAAGASFSKTYTMTVLDDNDVPTDILILNALAPDTIFVDELNAANDSIATLITVDQDTADTHTYEFVNEFESGDIFSLDGNVLKADIAFDHESTETYEVGIRTLDPEFEQTTKTFKVIINNVNEAPSNLFFVDADPEFRVAIDEGNAIGDSIATIGVSDPDLNDTHTFSLSGTGSEDFTLDGTTLRAAKVFDYNEATIYTLTLTAEDAGGLTYSEQVNVAINDITTLGPNQETALFTFTASSLTDEINGYEAYGTEFSGGTKPEPLTPSPTTDRFDTENNALLFSQDRSLTVAEPILDLSQSFSMNFWFRMDGAIASGNFQILFANAGLFIGLNEQEQLMIQGYNGTTIVVNETLTQSLTPQQWYMMTLVFDQESSQVLDVYLDATTELSTSVQSLNQVSEWYIGSSSGQMEFFGKMDDITFFQKALTSSEVSSLYDLNDNAAPTDISLDATAVDENQPIGTSIGTLTTTDADASDTHTYSLGGTDAASFSINGNLLQTAEVFDFETKSSYSIEVTSTDNAGDVFTKAFTITVNDTEENNNPTDITLSNQSVDENVTEGTGIGVLSTVDEDNGEEYSYSLSGEDATNFAVGIPSNTETPSLALLTSGVFDFEAKSSYNIDITTDDNRGGSFTKSFTITVNDVNEAPTAINLTKNTIEENQASGASIGYFTTIDPDTGDSHTISLGGEDASEFTTTLEFVEGPGNVYVLRTARVFDFEAKNAYSLEVTSTDQGSLSVTSSFTIEVTDQEPENNFPTAINLSSSTIAENEAAGTVIGTLSTDDPDANDSHTYRLSGVNETLFTIDGSELLSAESFDFETQDVFEITITTDDGKGGAFSENFTINITDVDDEGITLSIEDRVSFSTYPNPASEKVTLSLEDSGSGVVRLLDLKGQELIKKSVQGKAELDVSKLSKGTYLLELLIDNERIVNRVIVR